MSFKFQDHVDHKRETGAVSVAKPIPKKEMVKNSEGAFVFKTPLLKQVERFLIMGTEGGTFYISERKLTKDNCRIFEQALDKDYRSTIDLIVDISVKARCLKNETCIFALAVAASHKEVYVRKYALSKLNEVCRIGTHLFAFMEYSKYFRGRGRLFNDALKNWYLSKDLKDVSYQLVKYQSRNGWAHRDVLRLSKPVPSSDEMSVAFRWAVKKDVELEALQSSKDLKNILGFELAKRAESLNDICSLITQYSLTREMVPTQWLKQKEVWKALVAEDMPYTALIRNLATMTANGALSPLGNLTKLVVQIIKDEQRIKKSKVHPMQILTALCTYKSGSGLKGSLTWTPISGISDALEETFYKSFDNVTPTGKNFLLCLDVSSSMTWNCLNGIPLFTPRVASAVMAMVTMRSEENYHILAFASEVSELDIGKHSSLKQVMDVIDKTKMGSTNIGSAIEYAIKRNLDVDCFVIYTDNEVNRGEHVSQLIRKYRKDMNKPEAKLAVVAMESNNFSIADPSDPNMIDFAGFDSSTPAAISAFSEI